MERTVGTCSECGGRVTLPDSYMSVIPPVPTCQKCGARKKQPFGAVIQMDPSTATKKPSQATVKGFAPIEDLKSYDHQIETHEAARKGAR